MQYLGQIGTPAPSISDSLNLFAQQQQARKMANMKMAQDAIASGQYQQSPQQQQPGLMQKLQQSFLGPQVGGANMSMGGQNYQQVTPQMQSQQGADKLKMQMEALGMGGNPGANQASSMDQLEKEISIDPISGQSKITIKSKPQDVGIGGLTDVGNKTPEQLQAELKQTKPAYANYLKSLADGKLTLAGRQSKQIAQIQKDLVSLYPDTDMSKIQARYKTRTDFTTGNAAKNIRSLNTAVGHLSEFKKLIPQLHNSGFKAWNQLGQTLSRQFGGNPTLARFTAVKTALTGELANIYKNSGGTDQEIRHVMDSFDSADTKESLDAAADEMESLMSSRMGALQSQYHSAFDRPTDEDFPVMSPRSKKVLSSMGYTDIGSDTETIPSSTGGSDIKNNDPLGLR